MREDYLKGEIPNPQEKEFKKTFVNCMGDMMAPCLVAKLDTDWKPEIEKAA